MRMGLASQLYFSRCKGKVEVSKRTCSLEWRTMMRRGRRKPQLWERVRLKLAARLNLTSRVSKSTTFPLGANGG